MQTIERMIIAALMRGMRAAGYEVAAIWDGEEYVMGKGKSPINGVQSFPSSHVPDRMPRGMSDEEAFNAIDSVDECTLHFTHHNARTWGNRGVLIILGNGEDCLSDYHVAHGERFGEVVDGIYDRLQKGVAL